MPFHCAAQALLQRHLGLPSKQVPGLGNVRHRRIHVALGKGHFFADCFFTQHTLNKSNYPIQRDRCFTTSQIDDFKPRCFFHCGDRASCDVVNISKISGLCSVTINFQGDPTGNFFNKLENAHIRAACRTKNCEIAQNRHVNPIQLVITVSHCLGCLF